MKNKLYGGKQLKIIFPKEINGSVKINSFKSISDYNFKLSKTYFNDYIDNSFGIISYYIDDWN